jgi:hypothetical protein
VTQSGRRLCRALSAIVINYTVIASEPLAARATKDLAARRPCPDRAPNPHPDAGAAINALARLGCAVGAAIRDQT